MWFEIIGEISKVEVIASGSSIRELSRLQKIYGAGRWRKLKGFATVKFHPGAEVIKAEIHWYEAHGMGKKEFKIKRIIG